MYLFIAIIYSVQYKIQILSEERFIHASLKNNSPLNLVEFLNGTSFTFRSDSLIAEKIYLSVFEYPDFSLTANKDDNTVFLSTLKRSSDNLFTFLPIDFDKKTFWITNKTECLTWNGRELRFEMQSCCLAISPNQLFKVVLIDPEVYSETKTDELNAYYSKLKENKVEEVIKSHIMENEGENLILNSFNVLDNLDICFENSKVCQFSEDYIKNLYKAKGFKGYATSNKFYTSYNC